MIYLLKLRALASLNIMLRHILTFFLNHLHMFG